MPTLSLPQLDSIRIASPCHESWDGMTGDERVRHCESCDRRVYNLSAMTGEDALALIRKAEGRLCVRLYQRHDGSVMTADCPVGLAALRERAGKLAGRLAAGAALVLAATPILFGRERGMGDLTRRQPFRALAAWLSPAPLPPPIMGKMIMGEMACPTPPPTTGTTPQAPASVD